VKYSIRYTTVYRYDSPVHDQHNALRVRPATTANQRVDAFEVRVDPSARLQSYTDYFGTEVIEFNLIEGHERLSIEARARVTNEQPPEPSTGSWESVHTTEYRDAAGEFVLPAGEQPTGPVIEELAAAVRRETPAQTLQALTETIPSRFEYVQGATYVGSTVDDLLTGGAGVCQDFVHLGLILLRSHGIAARYVSGYLFAAAEEGDDSAEVQTHAWVEALLPSADGEEPAWTGADPTNRGLAGEQHVKIGHGRFYSDVPPIKGVFRGAAEAELDARVEMTRVQNDAA
jgi:transglutaminase-like putative cysteine protease